MRGSAVLLILLLVVAGALLPLLAIHLRGVWETCPSPSTGEAGGWACELQQTLIERGWLSPVSFHSGFISPQPQTRWSGQQGQQGQQPPQVEHPQQGVQHHAGDEVKQKQQQQQQQQQEQREKKEQQQEQEEQRERQQQEQDREQRQREKQQQQEKQRQEKQQWDQQWKRQEEEEEREEAQRLERQQREKQRQRQGSRSHDAEAPLSPADVERILKYPYVEDCNLCKVCIPTHLVAHHPKAQARLKARGLEVVQTPDPDIMIEVKTKSRLEKEQEAEGGGLHAGKQGAPSRESRLQRKLLASPQAAQAGQQAKEGVYRIKGHDIDISRIAPGMKVAEWRAKKPDCPVCWGCTHTLQTMAKGTRLLGSYYAHEPGGSPSWLFKVPTNRTQSGMAVVKVWCVPVVKPQQQGLGHCSPPKTLAQAKLVIAQHKLTSECGFSDIVPKLWIEPVNGVIPGHGFHINWLGLWSDVADGVSIENIKEHGKPHLDPDTMLDLFQNKLNHTEVKLAALFDLFTSQCDRHQQNYFLNERGKLWAIDNDQVYSVAWRHCGVDSLVLPTTQKFMINHLGWGYVMKFPHDNPPKTWQRDQHLLSLLDYRCHAGTPDGSIGFDYPPALRQCMTRLSGMLPPQIASEFGFPDIRLAEAFRNRSTSLLTKGFEWTLMYGEPLNSPPHRYKMAPKCCSLVRVPNSRSFRCAKPEGPKMHQLPYGNPSTGGRWLAAPEKDTGSYVGGTTFY